MVRFACAPKVAPKDADRASFSLTTSEVTLSRPSAAVRLGDVDAEQAEAGAAV